MSTMSKVAEQRIISAAERVAELVVDGDDPDDAIIKVSRALQLPPGHVTLVARAYNTGATNGRREGADDPIEKSADFPLADASSILERLFPTKVKTAAMLRREVEVSPEYSRPPTWYFAAQREHVLEKMASAVAAPLCDRKAPPLPSDPMAAMKKAYNACLDDEQRVVRARTVAATEKMALCRTLEALGDYFRAPGNLTVADVRDNVETIHGKSGAAVLDYVVSMRPALSKAAAFRANHSVREHAAPYRLVALAVDQAAHVLAFDAAVDQMAKESAAAREGRLAPFVPAAPTAPASLLDGLCSTELEKESAGDLSNMRAGVSYSLAGDLLHGLGNHIRGGHEKAEEDILRRISSPEHEQKLRDIQTTAMLQDFMANDPVIKGHDPYDVTNTFNRISQFAPRAASQPMMMEALMRRSLQGNVDQFEAGQLAAHEKAVSETHPHFVPVPSAKHENQLSLPVPSSMLEKKPKPIAAPAAKPASEPGKKEEAPRAPR